MGEYEDTVRYSLSNLNDGEIIKRLSTNSFTDEAKVVAYQVLTERGYKNIDGKLEKEYEEVEEVHQNTEPDLRNGFSASLLIIRIVFLFLLGSSIFISLPSGGADGDKAVIKFAVGFYFALIGGVVVAIDLYLKRNKTETLSEIRKKHNDSIKLLLGMNILISGVLVFSIFSDLTSEMVAVDLAILVGLSLALYKGVPAIKHIMAAYAFISAIVLAGQGFGSGGGFAWSFVFLTACGAIIAEKKLALLTNVNNKK